MTNAGRRNLETESAPAARGRTTPRRRAALTLAEVLISMGILTLGLLGVASLFPVGGSYMQSGDIADQGNALAQAALNDAITRGWLDPDNWVQLDPNLEPIPTGNAGRLETVPGLINRIRALDANGYNEEGYGLLTAGNPERAHALIGPGPIDHYLNRGYGAAFVIDPLGMASALNETSPLVYASFRGAAINSAAARRFPAFDGGPAPSSPYWGPFANPLCWPVRRVTTTFPAYDPNGNTYITSSNRRQMLQLPKADALFSGANDIALELPARGDDPALGRWQTVTVDEQAQPLNRQTRGDYSWLLTVNPVTSEARNALVSTPDAYPYDVSAVVFHKRVLGDGYLETLQAERLVRGRVVTTGIGGGEMLLERFYASSGAVSGAIVNGAKEPEESPFEELRSGQYVMVCGPHPLSTAELPKFFLAWYRVVNIDGEGEALNPLGEKLTSAGSIPDRRLVALRGPDWPWAESVNGGDNTELSNDLRVAIIPGAVAVHTKTMRLEAGSAWAVE
ncbi:type IV pilus modification PilV family protein [Pseudobythopirellula maris]|nr:hypothetical protein [Pseudobythopirellula maris]